jgi:hypothetical protein
LAGGDGFAPIGLELAHGLADRVVEVVIGGFRLRGHDDFDGAAIGEIAGSADGFEADARAFVGGLSFQQIDGIGDAIAPIAEHARGGGAGVGLGGFEHALEQIGIDDVVPLMHPQRLGHVVLVGGIVFVQRLGPLFHGGDHFI